MNLKFGLKISLLIFPFLGMFFFNKIYTPKIQTEKFNYFGINAQNTQKKNKHYCTWACYMNTDYCRDNHLKYLQGYSKYTDIPYEWIINSLKSFGDYTLSNIIILVTLIPICIWILVIKSINIQFKINKIKKSI